MDIHVLKNTVENSEQFEEYKTNNENTYLAHVFIIEKGPRAEISLGYYNPDDGEITSFTTEPTVRMTGADKPLGETHVDELALKSVSVSYTVAMSKADEAIPTKKGVITQKIIILQNLERPLWNITLVTNAFIMYNVRVDAQTGEILQQTENSLMDMAKMMPGGK